MFKEFSCLVDKLLLSIASKLEINKYVGNRNLSLRSHYKHYVKVYKVKEILIFCSQTNLIRL